MDKSDPSVQNIQMPLCHSHLQYPHLSVSLDMVISMIYIFVILAGIYERMITLLELECLYEKEASWKRTKRLEEKAQEDGKSEEEDGEQ